MSKVRAKFECVDIVDQPKNEMKRISFKPVIDGSDENKSFSKFTPSGNIKLFVSYETDADKAFVKGKEYYIDFSEAESKAGDSKKETESKEEE